MLLEEKGIAKRKQRIADLSVTKYSHGIPLQEYFRNPHQARRMARVVAKPFQLKYGHRPATDK
jgi:hypothetical protein